jgi:hypothetical protein
MFLFQILDGELPVLGSFHHLAGNPVFEHGAGFKGANIMKKYRPVSKGFRTFCRPNKENESR